MNHCVFCKQELLSKDGSDITNSEILSMIDVVDSDFKHIISYSTSTTSVCSSCLSMLKISYDLNSICEVTESRLKSYISTSSFLEAQPFSLIHLLEKEQCGKNTKSFPVCRTCLKKVIDNEFLFANGKVIGMQCEIGEMLNICFPKMNLLLTNEPILCKVCVEMLIMCYAFHTKFLSLEKKFSKMAESNIMTPSIDPLDINQQVGENKVADLSMMEMKEIKVEPDMELTNSEHHTTEMSSQFNYNEGCSAIQDMPQGPSNVIYIKQEVDPDLLNEEIKLEDGSEQSTPKNQLDTPQSRKPYKPLNKYYFCKSCTYTTKRKACLIKHKVVHLPGYKKTIYQCKECGYTVKRQKYLDLHLALHAKGVDFKKYKCDFCSFCTRKKCKLERHLTVHKDERETTMYQCSKCMFITKWKEYLSQHELIHNASEEEKKFKCDKCNFSTNWRGSLIQHNVVHLSGEEAFKFHCKECSYRTKRKDNLTKHMIRHMKDEDVRIFYCPECPFTSKFSSKLSRHLHVHKKGDELTIYKCDVCSFETRWKNNLSQHMRVHQDASEIDLFKCKDCPFTTKWKTCLTEHVVMHKTGEGSKEFKCSECDFNTKWKKSLNMHLLTHSTDEAMKKFKCNLCDYKTYRSHHLKRHLQVHSK